MYIINGNDDGMIGAATNDEEVGGEGVSAINEDDTTYMINSDN